MCTSVPDGDGGAGGGRAGGDRISGPTYDADEADDVAVCIPLIGTAVILDVVDRGALLSCVAAA